LRWGCSLAKFSDAAPGGYGFGEGKRGQQKEKETVWFWFAFLLGVLCAHAVLRTSSYYACRPSHAEYCISPHRMKELGNKKKKKRKKEKNTILSTCKLDLSLLLE
jgi:hypothetical protein